MLVPCTDLGVQTFSASFESESGKIENGNATYLHPIMLDLLLTDLEFHFRVLLSKPRLVLMDESTSALDTDNERHLYGMLQQAGITFVSIGHRPTLTQFHPVVLRLLGSAAGDGSNPGAVKDWHLISAAEAEAQLAAMVY